MKSKFCYESDFLLWVGFKPRRNPVIALAYNEEDDFCLDKEWPFVNYWTFYKDWATYRIDELYLDLTGCLDADTEFGRYA